MSKRKAITERMKIDALLYRAINRPRAAQCDLCRNDIEPGVPIDWDHVIPLGLNGDHDYTNLRPVHRYCHYIKTRGTKATTAGSDIGKISKERRIIRTAKFVVDRRKHKKTSKPKRKWPSRPLRTGRGFGGGR